MLRNARFSTSLILTLVFLILVQVASVGAVDVAISGTTEKIKSFKKNEITYFSFSELEKLLGGKLDWEIIGHQISYIERTNRFDFVLGSPFFRFNEAIHNLTFPAILKDGQLFLPAET
ncbi:MAG: hypothetical protein U9R56_06960, partial [candidate division Zixibacteria bacterium]|nr:hypothetical protein [candidate division Zixibacteria bacterium]